MSENWEVRIDLIWQKISWLRPCKSAANLFIGPTLPRAAAYCRLQCYDFGVRKKLFLKKGSCVHLPYSAYWRKRLIFFNMVTPNLINFIISCQMYHNLLFLYHVLKSFYTVTRFILVLLKPIFVVYWTTVRFYFNSAELLNSPQYSLE